MRLPSDPIKVLDRQPRYDIIASSLIDIGGRETQQDALANFLDQCFVVADGVGGIPHGDLASNTAAETAIWAYKLVRLRPFYWPDKKLFMKRIFRTTNMRVWNVHKDKQYPEPIATTLALVMLGETRFWGGSVGDSSIYLIRDGQCSIMTHQDRDSQGQLTKVLGLKRLGITPEYVSDDFRIGDTILVVSDGIGDFVSEEEMVSMVPHVVRTKKDLEAFNDQIIKRAKQNGSMDNMTIWSIVKAPHLTLESL